MSNESPTLDDLPPFLEDFREFSHIASELGRTIYEDWFDDLCEREEVAKRARHLSRHSLRFLQWENGSQESERVSVAVIGDFSSGKSSFINSLLGQEICPVNVAASTSSITTFKHGDKEIIYLVTDNDKSEQRQRQELTRQKYEELVTHQGKKKQNTNNRHEFEIYYPFEGFREIELYDTPGFNNSENSQDEAITREKCRSADVILFVFDINKGDLSADILSKVIRPLRREKPDQPIIAIVNKADTKPPGKAEEIRKGIQAKRIFNIVLNYSAIDEMSLWKKIEVLESAENVLPELRRSSPCKIETTNNGFVLTPLNPESLNRKLILKWMDEIRGQKAVLIKAKRQAEIKEYVSQGEALLKALKEYCKKEKINSKKKNSTKEQFQSTSFECLREEIGNAIASAIISSSSPIAITEGPNSSIFGGFLGHNYRLRFNRNKFYQSLCGAAEFESIKPVIDSFIDSIPKKHLEYLEVPIKDLLKISENAVELLHPVLDYLDNESESMQFFDTFKEAVAFRDHLISECKNIGWQSFHKEAMSHVEWINKHVEIHETQLSSTAEARSEPIELFANRINQFTKQFHGSHNNNL